MPNKKEKKLKYVARLQIGFEAEVETRIAANVYESAYANTSISVVVVGVIYMFINTGSWNSSLQPAY